ncbi:PREDICTED: LOW QUALITY PROTEIN [Prunus dulcis]|uniref:PREDICTED: LOW QUALITY PROTEIN n=1 Tax=Prunus dulcis TaxID=3755 RepID=A0A5E4FWJ7_PRUDU|nr:PREDICTED: LOW QUALITY PROTEIN [Prunus dulcis]
MALTIPTAGQPLKSSLSARANNSPSCIFYPEVEDGTQFELKPGILNLLPSFHGLPMDDPYMHLKLYHETVENILLRACIITWHQLQEKCLLKFFHASRTLALKKEILAFSQKQGEAFHETWERFVTSQVCAIYNEETHDITQCPSKAAFPKLVEEHVNDREKGLFPNQPEQNPRNQEHLKAVKMLRKGKTFDNRPNIEFEEEEAHIEKGKQHVTSNATTVKSLVPNAMSEALALMQEPNSH